MKLEIIKLGEYLQIYGQQNLQKNHTRKQVRILKSTYRTNYDYHTSIMDTTTISLQNAHRSSGIELYIDVCELKLIFELKGHYYFLFT
jgi:hypothetical protein